MYGPFLFLIKFFYYSFQNIWNPEYASIPCSSISRPFISVPFFTLIPIVFLRMKKNARNIEKTNENATAAPVNWISKGFHPPPKNKPLTLLNPAIVEYFDCAKKPTAIVPKVPQTP